MTDQWEGPKPNQENPVPGSGFRIRPSTPHTPQLWYTVPLKFPILGWSRNSGDRTPGAREGFAAPRHFWPLEIFRMPATSNRFRLIPAAPFDSGRAIAAFERVADAVQARDKCSRTEALQRACDEKPELFDEYCRAFRC